MACRNPSDLSDLSADAVQGGAHGLKPLLNCPGEVAQARLDAQKTRVNLSKLSVGGGERLVLRHLRLDNKVPQVARVVGDQ